MRHIAVLLFTLLANACPAQTGTPLKIGDSYEIQSKVLSERRQLNIYVPDDYNAADTAKYPVIYLLDGGMDEDFLHVVGSLEFNSQPWVARVPKSIVAGIVNVDRKRDFTFPTSVKSDKEKYPTTGGSSRFIEFMEQEVQPYVNAHYKTNGVKTLIGESLGGLLATEVLLNRPGLFNHYIIISPSLWWDNGSILKNPLRIAASQFSEKTTVYIGVGKEGLAPSQEPHVMEVDANVLTEKLEGIKSSNLTVFYDYFPDENHATIAHQALYSAFRKLYVPTK